MRPACTLAQHLPVCGSAPAWRAAPWRAEPQRASRRAFGSSKIHKIRRVDCPWKSELLRDSWHFLKQEMVHHFQAQPQRDSTVHIHAIEWPKFTMKEELLEQGLMPSTIKKYGPPRRVAFNKAELERVAFDEEDGHLSHLFKGRLFRVYVGKWIEECVVLDCNVHPVERLLEFVSFARHVPGRVTEVPVPVTLSGLWGCPGYRNGGHVELAMPTIRVECVGEKIPPPFIVDVTRLRLDSPYGKITLRDIQGALPSDGTARFAREYTLDEEVVMCYNPKAVPEVPLPQDWRDPNFKHRGGYYHLTYTGFWPKQVQRQ